MSTETKQTTLEQALEILTRIRHGKSWRDWRIVVRKFNPGGLSGHQTTEVSGIFEGFDWEAGKIIVTPALQMTELTPEQVEDITKSVRAGGSWHAYQREKKAREQMAVMLDALKAVQIDAVGIGAGENAISDATRAKVDAAVDGCKRWHL